MSIFQLIALFFALFMMYVVNVHRRKLRLSLIEVSFWFSMWGIFMVISLFPNLLLDLAQTLRFTRVFDFLVVVAFMILTVIVISSYFAQRENQKKLEEVVRLVTLKEAEKKR